MICWVFEKAVTFSSSKRWSVRFFRRLAISALLSSCSCAVSSGLLLAIGVSVYARSKRWGWLTVSTRQLHQMVRRNIPQFRPLPTCQPAHIRRTSPACIIRQHLIIRLPLRILINQLVILHSLGIHIHLIILHPFRRVILLVRLLNNLPPPRRSSRCRTLRRRSCRSASRRISCCARWWSPRRRRLPKSVLTYLEFYSWGRSWCGCCALSLCRRSV